MMLTLPVQFQIMKKILLILSAVIFATAGNAQVLKSLGEKAKNKLNQRANNKVDRAMDKGLDKAEESATGKGSQNQENSNGNSNIQNSEPDADVAEVKKSSPLKAYSKYDFIQGERVVAYEDFSNTAIGDFPTRWNTNGSAEVVTINKKEGKWLKIGSKGILLAEFINGIPENSTLEFDLGVNDDFAWGNHELKLILTDVEKESFTGGTYNPTIFLEFHPLTGENNKSGGVDINTSHSTLSIYNSAKMPFWDNKENKFVHISIWRQGQRLRMYAGGQKLFDLPRAFDAKGKFTTVMFRVDHFSDNSSDYYLLGNIRLAIGAPDTRNKLVTEGKFVTSGITFDVNSDKLKNESVGVIREVATVLGENPDMKVKITGHTDGDGDAAKNLDLSKRRAAAVKASLVSDFGIDESRIHTDGKGASVPVADNKTIEGKAQNRRVEFVKL